jgi:hypothetical protein
VKRLKSDNIGIIITKLLQNILNLNASKYLGYSIYGVSPCKITTIQH